MKDLIERQAAIDAFTDEIEITGRANAESVKAYVKLVIDRIKRLPSAQPETHEERTETLACDCISRQAAIDTDGLDEEIRCEMCVNPMRTNRGCDGHCKYDEKLYERIMQILSKRIKPLTSAQPEIIQCKDCKFSHMTINGECKYCDIWFPDEKCYMSGDYYCGSAERREE